MSRSRWKWLTQCRVVARRCAALVGLCAGMGGVIACLDSYDLSLGMRPDADSGQTCDAGSCAECQTDRDCDRPSLPRCDLETHSCVRCLSMSDCDDGRLCSSAWHRCVEPCEDSDDCSDRDRPFCEREQSACVECRDSGDCRVDCVRGVCD
jgi:hypothetical protein